MKEVSFNEMGSSMSDRLEKVIRHPLHQHLGIRTIESEGGVGAFSIQVNEHTLNPGGMFHGGVLYLLCDVCAYAGLLSLMDDQTEAVTHDIQVSVMRPAKFGDRIDFRSRVIRRGRRLCFIEVEATVGGDVLGTAKVTKSMLGA